MAFRRGDGGNFTTYSNVSTTDLILVDRNGNVGQIAIQSMGESLGFVTSASVDQFITCASVETRFLTKGSANSFITTAEADVRYVTSVELNSALDMYLTKVSSSAFVRLSEVCALDYLTRASSSAFTKTGEALTTAQGDARYMTQASVSSTILDIVSAQDYITSTEASAVLIGMLSAIGAGITQASVSTLVCGMLSGYATSNYVSATYLTKTSSSAFLKLAEVCTLDYLTRASSSAFIKDAQVSTLVCGMLSGYITSNTASATYLTKTSSSAFIKDAQVSTLVCGMLSGYITSNNASATYLTKTSSSAFLKLADVCALEYLSRVSSSAFLKLAEVCALDYLTRASSSAFIKDAQVSTLVCGMLSGYITSTDASSTYLTKASSSGFISSACAAAIFPTKEQFLAGFIDIPEARSYPIITRSPRNYILTSCAAKTASGVLYMQFVVSGVTVTPTSTSVGSTLVTFDVCTTISAGTRVLLQITSASASAFEWTAVVRQL